MKSDIAFLIGLAKKIGMSTNAFTKAELEDWKFVQKIDTGMKTSTISRNEIMKALWK